MTGGRWQVVIRACGRIDLTTERPGVPWYVVDGEEVRDGDGPAYARWHDRVDFVLGLCDHLNGAPRPAGLDDFGRQGDRATSGGPYPLTIAAAGPLLDIDPGRRAPVTDMSPAARAARKMLMDRLFPGRG